MRISLIINIINAIFRIKSRNFNLRLAWHEKQEKALIKGQIFVFLLWKEKLVGLWKYTNHFNKVGKRVTVFTGMYTKLLQIHRDKKSKFLSKLCCTVVYMQLCDDRYYQSINNFYTTQTERSIPNCQILCTRLQA